MESKIIIGGTGRAGTTLLMRIFTVAGLDTGFSERDILQVENNEGRAGLERLPNRKNFHKLPRIIKSPMLDDKIPRILAGNWFPIGLAIIPIRNLREAAQSRVAVHERAVAEGLNPKTARGGLWKTDKIENQHWVLA